MIDERSIEKLEHIIYQVMSSTVEYMYYDSEDVFPSAVDLRANVVD